MKIEVTERDGTYHYTDVYGTEASFVIAPKIDSDVITDAIKLKDAGFTSEEVFRLLRQEK